MKIHLRQLSDGGEHFEGTEECPIPQVNAEEVRCAGPLRYALEVGISEGALWAKGELAQPVELRCVRCLERFPFEITVPDFGILTDLTGPELLDLTPFMREDILLNLPPYPHCDRDGGRVCPVPEEAVSGATAEPLEARPPDWSALDDLKL